MGSFVGDSFESNFGAYSLYIMGIVQFSLYTGCICLHTNKENINTMTIKEIEEASGMQRANIRFYEEGDFTSGAGEKRLS